MSADNVTQMWAACADPDADRTDWLVLADALDEDGQHGAAAHLRGQEFVEFGGRVWPRRLPDWHLVYDPDADPGGQEMFYGRGCDGTYFVSRWGMVVRGRERAEELLTERVAALALLGHMDPNFTIEDLDVHNLDGDNQEHEDLVEDIASRFVPW